MNKTPENIVELKEDSGKYSVAVKDSLARILAAENITVVHGGASTAAFDVLNRTLILPDWDCSRDLYTLLITHEVGHALYTPNNDTMSKIVKDQRLMRVANCIEDVRIEKLMLSKFPGFRRDFHLGYSEMNNNDFFGLEKNNKPLEDYHFFDRINLHYKLGRYTDFSTPFSAEESVWVQRVDQCDTFEELVDLAQRLIEWQDEQQQQQKQQQQQQQQQSNSGQNKNQAAGNGSNESQNTGSGDVDNDSESSESQESNGGGDELSTQESMESALRDINNGYAYSQPANVTMPVSIDIEQHIIGYKDILKSRGRFYNKDSNNVGLELAKKHLQRFTQDNKKIIANMINLFNMKKSAKIRLSTRRTKLGGLDMKKLHQYKYSVNIFLRNTSHQKGKNHGLVMFLDQSSSMSNNMAGSIEQVLLLAKFCQKLNIHFDVYGFSNTHCSLSKEQKEYRKNWGKQNKNVGELVLDSQFHLNQYLSSSMNTSEFNTACTYLIAIRNHYLNYCHNTQHADWDDLKDLSWRELSIHRDDRLSGTPLDETILSARYLVENLKKTRKLDIVNVIFVTDGDNTNPLSNVHVYRDGYKGTQRINTSKLFVKDSKAGKTWSVQGVAYHDMSQQLLKILKETTGCNVLGFFLDSEYSIRYSLEAKSDLTKEKITDLLEQDGYIEVVKDGYDSYYYIPDGRGLSVASSGASIYDAKQRAKSRIFLNRFIEQIA